MMREQLDSITLFWGSGRIRKVHIYRIKTSCFAVLMADLIYESDAQKLRIV